MKFETVTGRNEWIYQRREGGATYIEIAHEIDMNHQEVRRIYHALKFEKAWNDKGRASKYERRNAPAPQPISGGRVPPGIRSWGFPAPYSSQRG